MEFGEGSFIENFGKIIFISSSADVVTFGNYSVGVLPRYYSHSLRAKTIWILSKSNLRSQFQVFQRGIQI